MIVRLAAGLARTAEPGHRWRRVAMATAAAGSTLLLLVAASLMALAQREDARGGARTGVEARPHAADDLLWLERGDDHDGRAFPVVWLQPAGPAPPVLPPGMARLPEPGEAAVSPALDALAQRDPVLAGRYPRRIVLDGAGVRSGGELLAYVRPLDGRSLRSHRATFRIGGFRSGGDVSLNQESGITAGMLVGGSAAFLFIPAVLVLLAGTASSSVSRTRRFSILRALGARERTVAALAVAETILLALPGVLVAVVAWTVAAPGMSRVPGVEHAVVSGDLGLSAAAVAAAVAIELGLCALLALALFGRPGSRRASARPGADRQPVRAWRLLPLGLALGLAAGAASMGGRVGAMAMLVAVVGALAALPLAGARLLPGLGGALAATSSTAALLTGRRLEWNPAHHGRPFAVTGVLVLLGILTGCYVAILRSAEPGPVPAGPYAAVTVRWVDPRAPDVGRLDRQVGDAVTIGMSETPAGLALHARCESLGRPLGIDCARGGAAAREEVARLLGLPGPQAVRFGGAATGVPSAALVVARGDVRELDATVRTAAQRELAAPTVSSALGRLRRQSTLDRWLETGLAVAGLALALAALAMAIDGTLRARGPNDVLLRLGMPQATLARLEVALFCIPYLTLAGLGGTVGAGFALLFAQVSGVAIPAAWAFGVAAAAISLGAVGAAIVGVLGLRAPERQGA
jgi:hypothetical protein